MNDDELPLETFIAFLHFRDTAGLSLVSAFAAYEIGRRRTREELDMLERMVR